MHFFLLCNPFLFDFPDCFNGKFFIAFKSVKGILLKIQRKTEVAVSKGMISYEDANEKTQHYWCKNTETELAELQESLMVVYSLPERSRNFRTW